MSIQLTITEDGDSQSQYVRSFLQDRIVIGRARSSDVCLPDMAVSTRHAEIRVSGNDYVVMDLDSLNGTRLDDKTLTAFRPRTLKNGDCLTIANFSIVFRLGAGAGKEEPRDTSVRHAKEILANVLARAGAPQDARSLVVVSGPHRASRFDLPKEGTLIIGRAKDADIILDDRDVWKKHAEITITKEGVTVRDLCAGPGLKVAGNAVESVVLAPDDQFTVGKTTIALEHPAARSLGAIFEAPEEDTSSIALATGVTGAPKPSVSEAEDATEPEAQKIEPETEREPPVQSRPETKVPPVGPADPLVPDNEPRDPPTIPQLPVDSSDKTDIGLILIGAIIVLAAVGALVYLYS